MINERIFFSQIRLSQDIFPNMKIMHSILLTIVVSWFSFYSSFIFFSLHISGE